MSQRKSDRAPYGQRLFRLVDDTARQRAIAMIANAPLDKLRPLEVCIRGERKQRGDRQNALYWALLNEIAEQAWIEGRQYSAEILHAYLKRSLLPEDEHLDADEVRENYQKWQFDPAGERVLVGSTTMLTVRGMNNYITAVEAFGSTLGVHFTSKEQA